PWRRSAGTACPRRRPLALRSRRPWRRRSRPLRSARAPRAAAAHGWVSGRRSSLEGRRAEVAERFGPRAHGLTEALARGLALERVALLRVTGDPVEHGPDHLRGVQSLGEQ